VIKLISLGHAKLAQTIEDRERDFFEKAHYNYDGAPGVVQAAVQGGALRTKMSNVEIGERLDYLAPEYHAPDCRIEDHYVMDWFSGLNPGLALQLNTCCDATVKYVVTRATSPLPTAGMVVELVHKAGQCTIKEWKTEELMDVLKDLQYFVDNRHHLQPIIEALVAMRKEADSPVPDAVDPQQPASAGGGRTMNPARLNPESIRAMTSEQAAQEAAARAGIPSPDDCVRALTGNVHGRSYSTGCATCRLQQKMTYSPHLHACALLALPCFLQSA
jgi:hypothetical protein